MNTDQTLDRKYGLMAWGLLFVWWGLRWWLLAALPNGSGLIGTGLILLGLNAARSLKGIPTQSITISLGILVLALGGAAYLTIEVFHLSAELPLFETSLIVLGAIFFISALRVRKNALGA